MKRFFFYITFGMAIGILATTWLGPKVIGWYFNPPVNIGVNCYDAITWAMNRLVITQLAGLGVGLLLGLVAFLMIGRKSEPKNPS